MSMVVVVKRQKVELRHRMKVLVGQEGGELRLKKVVKKIQKLVDRLRPKCVLGYVAIAGEVDVLAVGESLGEGQVFGVPVCDESGLIEGFAEFRRGVELVRGKKGVWEPDEKRFIETKNVEKAVVLVPGVAFDKKGNRLGRGGGAYDQWLAKYPEIVKVGVCFDRFLMEVVPMEEHDVGMDWVVSEKGVFRCEARR